MTERKQYYHKIYVYERRREALREKYWGTPEYKEKVRNINTKIGSWRRQIRVKDEDRRKTQVMALGNAVAIFLGYNVKDSASGSRGDKRRLLARAIFFKHGLESGINGKFLREYTGDSRKNAPTDSRISFNKSFTSFPEHKDIYHRFLKYMEELGAESIKEITKKVGSVDSPGTAP